MKKILFLALSASFSAALYAEGEKGIQYNKLNTEVWQLEHESPHIDMENGVTGIADDRGFTLQSKDGKFVFKPYLFLQTRGMFNYYDDEGLDKAYNQDNVANSGFSVPYAIIGFTGTTFGRLDYNICVNAAGSGGNVLQQAWVASVWASSRRLSATPI